MNLLVWISAFCGITESTVILKYVALFNFGTHWIWYFTASHNSQEYYYNKVKLSLCLTN
jgi:hypothetical protein